MSAPDPIVLDLKLTQAERELLLFGLATLRYELRYSPMAERIDAMRDRLKGKD